MRRGARTGNGESGEEKAGKETGVYSEVQREVDTWHGSAKGFPGPLPRFARFAGMYLPSSASTLLQC